MPNAVESPYNWLILHIGPIMVHGIPKLGTLDQSMSPIDPLLHISWLLEFKREEVELYLQVPMVLNGCLIILTR